MLYPAISRTTLVTPPNWILAATKSRRIRTASAAPQCPGPRPSMTATPAKPASPTATSATSEMASMGTSDRACCLTDCGSAAGDLHPPPKRLGVRDATRNRECQRRSRSACKRGLSGRRTEPQERRRRLAPGLLRLTTQVGLTHEPLPGLLKRSLFRGHRRASENLGVEECAENRPVSVTTTLQAERGGPGDKFGVRWILRLELRFICTRPFLKTEQPGETAVELDHAEGTLSTRQRGGRCTVPLRPGASGRAHPNVWIRVRPCPPPSNS